MYLFDWPGTELSNKVSIVKFGSVEISELKILSQVNLRYIIQQTFPQTLAKMTMNNTDVSWLV